MKKPCGLKPKLLFVMVNGSSNWADTPNLGIPLKPTKKATTALKKCQSECLRRTKSPKKTPPGCAALSIRLSTAAGGNVTTGTPLRYCDLYNQAVPGRVCGAGDSTGSCVYGSEGSYRLKYFYKS